MINIPIVIIFIFVILFIGLIGLISLITLSTQTLKKHIKDISYKGAKNNKKNKNITIVTMETRSFEALQYHNKNLEEYCLKHGYRYIFLDLYENKLKLPIYWKKIQLVQEILLTLPSDEYVMWMDSDTMICHNEISLNVLIEDNEKSIFIGNDFPNIITNTYNAGVFIIKNNERGKRFIDDCIKMYLSNKECRYENGEFSLGKKWAGSCYEQGIMNKLLKSEYNNDVQLIANHFLLNTNMPITSTFILHLFDGNQSTPSVRNKFLTEQFKRIYNKYEILPSRLDQFFYRIHSLYLYIKKK
jgi:hypothetical protein